MSIIYTWMRHECKWIPCGCYSVGRCLPSQPETRGTWKYNSSCKDRCTYNMDTSRSINNPKWFMIVYPLIFYQCEISVHNCSDFRFWETSFSQFHLNVHHNVLQSNRRCWQQSSVIVQVQWQSTIPDCYLQIVIMILSMLKTKFQFVTAASNNYASQWAVLQQCHENYCLVTSYR